jgi:exosortase/archaeosortase
MEVLAKFDDSGLNSWCKNPALFAYRVIYYVKNYLSAQFLRQIIILQYIYYIPLYTGYCILSHQQSTHSNTVQVLYIPTTVVHGACRM